MPPAQIFLSGLITMGFLVAGVFFLRFWTRSRDILFLAFAAAFLLLALQQAILALSAIPREEQSWSYLLRLAAFTCIAAVIIYKNTAGRRERD